MKLQIIRNKQVIELNNLSADKMLLDVLREDLGVTSCKEGCGEGDCGACCVVLGQINPSGGLTYKAVNACIRLASSVQGCAVWTAQDITAASGELHPVQQAMRDHHASQCGFCTPGFVMSLFALYQTQVQAGQTITRDQAQHALSGNLCRCTGYQSILTAATSLQASAAWRTDEAALIEQLKPLQQAVTLNHFLQQKHARPQAQVIAGMTDVGLWINKGHRHFDDLLDITQVLELGQIELDEHQLTIGAGVSLNDAFAALLNERPALKSFVHRFAGLPVRQSGTLGGNIANGSPIGDSMPLLIALGSSVTCMRWETDASEAKSGVQKRSFPLEQLYLGYKQLAFLPHEVLTHIHIPRPSSHEFLRAYKVSKRFEDDISAVSLAINLVLKDGRVEHIAIGAGGVAATPMRALKTQSQLLGQVWCEETITSAQAAITQEFSPISDMRASARYRQKVLAQLLRRFWLESQGHSAVNLEDIALTEELMAKELVTKELM